MNRTLDYRTDFYSLGATFYRLLTHRLPFECTDALEMLHYHLAVQPIPPHVIDPEVPEAVSNIVVKLLAKMPEERYQSAFGIRADLECAFTQLQEGGSITVFPLGQRDTSEKFQVIPKLYGREAEIHTLLSTFEQVSQKQSHIVLVSGYSGIGKSVLVQEIYKPITQRKGYFISGKFDQYERNIPYFAIAQAFEALVRHLLSESESQLYQWRDRILSALGRNAQVITAVIPALELIIGPQSEVADLLPTEAQNRFNRVFQQFIQVFTRPEHPLVLFLDDLQWADAASLKLIQSVTTVAEHQSLMVIGTYRENEVTPSHPLRVMIAELQSNGVPVTQLRLSPLHLTHTNQLIAETLHCKPNYSLPLAELIQRKTEGNPFFINEFLTELHAENLLKFNHACGTWQWSMDQIQAKEITDNVVSLVIHKIQKLSDQGQRVLQLAACIGNPFELETLAIAAQRSVHETALALHEALAQGLVVPLSPVYRSAELAVSLPANHLAIKYKFAHDRIQQAAYSLIAEPERQSIHQRLGRYLLQQIPASRYGHRIFDIVNQLNQGGEPPSLSDRIELAQLNLTAARKAKASTAYNSALKYLLIGIDCLDAACWQSHYDLTQSIYVEALEAAYLNGDFVQMEQWADIVLKHANSLLDKVKVFQVKIQAYDRQAKLLKAVEIALQVLQQLGIHFPERPQAGDIQLELEKTMNLIPDRSIEELIHLPQMSDQQMLAAMQILSSIFSPAYKAAPELLPLIVFKMVGLSINYGHTSVSAYAYAVYGLILCGIVGDTHQGYQFGELALKLVEQLHAQEIKARVGFVFNNNIRHWKSPVIDTIRPLQAAYHLGLETGDLEYASYAALNQCSHSYFVGMNLIELEQEIAAYDESLDQLKQEVALNHLRLYWQVVLNLIGGSDKPYQLQGDAYDEGTMLLSKIAASDRSAICKFHLHKLILCYLFGLTEEAVEQAALTKQYLDGEVATLLVAIFHFYDSLAQLAVSAEANQSLQAERLQRVAANQNKMQHWANDAPVNHLHRFWLVEAERYRVRGQALEAMDAYDRAIALARENNYIHEEALANELAAQFYLSRQKPTIARAYLQEARYGYSRWGATAKVQDLDRRYPQLLDFRFDRPSPSSAFNTRSSASGSAAELDLATVMKASRAIAREIVLDQLLTKLMRILIENAGAQTGYLLLPTDGELRIEAIGSVDHDRVAVSQSISLDESAVDHSPLLPSAIINYVVHTQDSVVLDHAAQEGPFKNDPWISQHQAKSILCAPLVDQGQLTGVVYLENNLTTQAFTPDRVELLDLLSTQAAIAIDNARLLKRQAELNASLQVEIAERKQAEAEIRTLNAELEERVRQRTAQLEAINRELNSFAYSVSHDLRAPLRHIHGFASALQQRLEMGSTVDDPKVTHYLQVIEQSSQKMGQLIDGLLALSRVGRQEITFRPVEVRRLVEVAIDLVRPPTSAEADATIEFQIGDLPTVQGDVTLLQQVFTNLIGNAVKFSRDRTPARIEVSSLPDGTLFVKDNGVGFSMEYADQLFGVFQRLHPQQQFEGTGIGLSIVQRIIHRHGGKIWAESQPERGAVFYFTLENCQ